MKHGTLRSDGEPWRAVAWWCVLFNYHGSIVAAPQVDVASLCTDRTAVERVYHDHRTGTKLPFHEAMSPALVEKLVREELKREAVLERAYGVEITKPMVDAEAERINTTTRAPEILAEIKAALGNDAERFGRSVARPLVVERTLRALFENDDALHAPQRRIAEALRARMLAVKESGFDARLAVLKECKEGEVRDQVKWELTARPASDVPAAPATAARATKGKASGGLYTNEATVQVAQVLSSPEKAREEKERKSYFEDLPAELQTVLRTQLRQPGDVGAVIETSSAFLVFLCKEKTDATLTASSLTIPKRSYEEWLAQPLVKENEPRMRMR